MEDRNPNGSFKKGNPGGPGRPKRLTEIAYAKALIDAVSLDDWQAVVKAAVEQAKAGDAKAREFLARHLIGEPTLPSVVAAKEALDPTGEKLLIQRLAGILPDDVDEFLFQSCHSENHAKAEQILNGDLDPEQVIPHPDQ